MVARKRGSIPATLVLLNFNEIAGLRTLIRKIPHRRFAQCFAVDPGSRDGSREFLIAHGIPILHQKKLGRGVAFQLAIVHAKHENVVFFSPDGNEDPVDILHIVKLLSQGQDMVIASRFLPESHNEEDEQFLKLRKWANQTFTMLVNLRWRGHITDSINGYRGIKKSAFENMRPDASGFSIEYQLTIRALKHGLKITEIPTQEGDRIGGESKAQSIPTGLVMLRTLWRELLE